MRAGTSCHICSLNFTKKWIEWGIPAGWGLKVVFPSDWVWGCGGVFSSVSPSNVFQCTNLKRNFSSLGPVQILGKYPSINWPLACFLSLLCLGEACHQVPPNIRQTTFIVLVSQNLVFFTWAYEMHLSGPDMVIVSVATRNNSSPSTGMCYIPSPIIKEKYWGGPKIAQWLKTNNLSKCPTEGQSSIWISWRNQSVALVEHRVLWDSEEIKSR